MFNKIAIIGFGLIGSSLARDIKEKALASSISCGDISQDFCDKVLELGLADSATTNITDAVKDADLIILATPVGIYGEVSKQIAGSLKSGSIVIDVGSVKQQAIADIAPNIPDGVHFIPCHPVSGRETTGPEAGLLGLFSNRWCILTPDENSSDDALQKVKSFWEGCGANVEVMDAKRHDMVLAVTSHLPHLIAYSIVDTAATLEDATKSEVIKYSAGGFRDFTRIAASDPIMWRDIFLNNKEAVLETLQMFNEDITALQKAIRIDDGDTLEKVFERTRDIRREVIEANKK